MPPSACSRSSPPPRRRRHWLRSETEQRVHYRIAEASAPPTTGVHAAEEEAAEIVRMVQADATRLHEAGQAEAAKAIYEDAGVGSRGELVALVPGEFA